MLKKPIMIIVIFFTVALCAKEEKISLQLQYYDQFQFAGYYMAKEKGFYKEAGLDVSLKKYSPEIIPLEEVLKGNSTYGIGRSSMLIDVSEGKNITPLVAIFQSSPQILLSTPASKITSLQDMKEKFIMITHDSLDSVAVMAMLNSRGIHKDDFTPIEHDYNLENLIENKIDVMSAYLSNEPYTLQQKGIKPIIFYPKEYGFDFYEDILFTDKDELENHPQRVDAFVQASLRGWEYAFAHIDESVDVILQKYNMQKKSKKSLLYEANTLKEMAYIEGVPLGNISKAKIQRIQDIYRVMGIIKDEVDFDKVFYKIKSPKMTLTDAQKRYLENKKEIKMCVDPDWMPYESIVDGKHIGIVADIMRGLEKKLKTSFSLVPTHTWDESLKRIENRECDIVSLAMATATREAYLKFTKPYVNLPYVIATEKDKEFIGSADELEGKKVVVIKKYAIAEILKNNYDNIDVVEVFSIKEALKMVAEGKVFGFVDSIATIRDALGRYHYHDSIKISGKLNEVLHLSVGVRNDDTVLFDIFSKAVNSMDEESIHLSESKWTSVVYHDRVDYSLLWKLLAFFTFLLVLMMWAYNKLSKTKGRLEESVNNFETLFNTTRDIVVVINKDLKIEIINQAGIDTFGYTKEEIYALCVEDFTDKESENVVELIRKLKSSISFELELYTKDGVLVTLLVKGKDIIFNSHPVKVLILTNVTDVKNTQQKLLDLNHSLEEKVAQEVQNSRKKDKKMLQQSRLAQMGEMISMIAHQWRQPLGAIAATGIDMKMSLMLGKYDLSNQIERAKYELYMNEELDNIDKYVQNLTHTIDDFRNFYKPNKEREVMSIQIPFEKALGILKGTIQANGVQVETSLKSTKELALFSNELMQVFLNILKNSMDNFKEKKVKNPHIMIESKDTTKGIMIMFCDNGGGISKDILHKVFDPYFSTKSEKNGTGLGLYMSKTIVEEHHDGRLSVEHSAEGVCFSVEIYG